jgi:hypothetical protein
MARTKFLSWPVEEPEAVLIRTDQVPKLLKDSKFHRPSRAKGDNYHCLKQKGASAA